MRWTHKSQNEEASGAWSQQPLSFPGCALQPQPSASLHVCGPVPHAGPPIACSSWHLLKLKHLLPNTGTTMSSAFFMQWREVGGKKQLWLYYLTVHMKVLAQFAPQWQIPNQPDSPTASFLFCFTLQCHALLLICLTDILIIHFQSKHFRLTEIYFFQLKRSLPLCSF